MVITSVIKSISLSNRSIQHNLNEAWGSGSLLVKKWTDQADPEVEIDEITYCEALS